MRLKGLESLLDQVTEIQLLALGIVDFVAHIHVLGLVEVHDGESLAVVGDEGLSDGL